VGDDAEDFAVVATFRKLIIPQELQPDLMTLVNKVLQVSETLLDVADHLALLQKGSFEGPEAEVVLEKITQICHMEWESDRLSRTFARHYYSVEGLDVVTIILLENLSQCLDPYCRPCRKRRQKPETDDSAPLILRGTDA